MGQATSDYLVHHMDPAPAVALGARGFAVSLALQLRATRYVAATYWLAVVMVAVCRTMAGDVLHVRFRVAYAASTALYGAALVAVFATWYSSERTLSIHHIDTRRRELSYWAAVVATFALGTAAGDLFAVTRHLGYLSAVFDFAGAAVLLALGYRLFPSRAVATF